MPTKNAFKFTVAADNGYTLTKVTVKVSGKESTLTADGNGVYTVAAADVATGASIKLVTEKQVQAQPAADTTPIEKTETQAPAASQPAAGQAAGSDSSADAGNNQSASGDAGNQESTAENADESGESSDQQGSEEANGNETSQDEAAADGQSEEASESDAAQLQMLGNEFLSTLSDSNSAISGPTSVAQADTITLTYNGEGTPQFWNGGDGLFSTWQESADHKTLTLTATSNWAFNGSSKNAIIYCAYIDNEGVWHTADSGAAQFTVTVTKRSFTLVQPDPVAAGADHFWIPSIIDNATGKVIKLSDAPSGSFYPFEYYRDGVKIENASQYYYSTEEFSKPGKYTVVVKPNSGWIYDFQGEVTIVVPTVGEQEFNTDDPVDCVYDGNPHKWAPTVTDSDTGAVLTEGTDYDLAYSTNDFINPGAITVTITGKGAYKNSNATKTYHIIKVSISGKDSIPAGTDTTYTPEGFTSDVTWSSSDSSILEIDPVTGKATGVYPGKVTIYAVDKEGHMASKDVTVTTNDQKGSWVYVYTKVVYNGLNLSSSAEGRAKAKELGLAVNKDGWFTLGKVWVSDVKAPNWQGQRNTAYQQKTLATFSKIERFNANGSINLDDITWNPYIHCANGAADYPEAPTNAWHLDGEVDLNSMTNVNIHHVDKASGKELTSEQLTVQVNKEFDPASAKRDFEGYTFDSADPAFTPEEGQVKDVYLYYTKGTFPYTVKYVEKDTGEELHAPVQHGGEYGSEVTEDALDIQGYDVDAAQKTLKIGTDGNEITFYYTKKAVDYTVNYYVNGTTDKVQDSQTISGRTYGETVTADQPSVGGYTLVPGQNPTITLSEDTHEINVYYYKNVALTANSDTKTYDGMEKSVSGFTGAPSDADFSSISVGAKGTDADTYPAQFPEGTKGTVDGTGKYIVTDTTDGQLVINPVKDEVVVTIKGNTDSQKYDGTEKSVSGYNVESISNSALAASDVALKSGVSASAKGTDANTYYMGLNSESFQLMGKAAKNFENVKFEVEDGHLDIAKRDMTLTSGSDEKVYDGTPLTKKEVTASGDGFADGEGADYTYTGSRTEVGESDNTFGYTLKSNTKASNYNIETKPGTLKVTPMTDTVTVVIAGKSGNETYDGTTKSLSGYDVKSIKINGEATSLYSEKDFVYTGGDADVAQGTDADTYDMSLTAAMFKNQNGNFKNVEFQIENGQLVISPRPVTLTSASDSKPYDGTPLTNNQVTVGGKGFVEGQGATYNVTGSQTLVGSSNNTFDYTLNNGTLAKNYNITKAEGTLTVTNRDAKYEITVEANSNESTYNGKDQSLTGLKSTTFTVDGHTYTVSGLEASSGNVKNVGEYPVSITGTPVVKDAAGNDVTSEFKVNTKSGTFKINQRKVTLTSGSDKKVYDGTALTNSTVTASGDGFADGEGATYSVTGSQTDVGTSNNDFTYALNEGTLVSNYTIETKPGTLEVTPVTDKVTVTIQGATKTETYDGKEKSASGYTTTVNGSSLYNDKDFAFSGTAEVKDTDFKDGGYAMGLAAGQFENTSKNFTNVEFVVYDGSLVISKRAVTVKSESHDFTYNGQAQTWPNASCDDDVFNAQTNGLTATGSVTNVGDVKKNAISYNWNEGCSADNFTITPEEGTLTVSPVQDEVTVTIKGHKGGGVYSGSEQTVEGYDFESSNGLYKPSDFTFSGSAVVKGTDFKDGGYAMGLDAGQFKNTSKNFVKVTFKVEDGQLNIAQRKVALKSEGHTWTYTGETFTLPNVSGWRQSGDEGFVTGEVSDVTATGSVKNVGDEQTNAITWTNGANYKASNYEISKEEGTLKVEAGNDIRNYVTLTPADVTATYDGKDHSAGIAKAEDKNGGQLTIEYSADGQNWTTNPADITAKNVNDSRNGESGKNAKVQVRVSSKNYTGYVTGEESITITKRVVSLSSATDSKPYDGTPLTRTEVTVTGDGFADGEVTKVEATGTVTNVAEGTVNNTIVYTTGDGFDGDNYSISKTEGKLNITPGTGIANKVTLDTASLGHLYDGTAHKLPASNAKASDDSPLVIEYSVDGKSWTKDPSTITAVNVRDSKKVQVRVSSTNFSDTVMGEAQLNVIPRRVTVTSQTASKVYDGTPLTKPEVTVGANLFLSDEVTNVRATGTVTNVSEGTVTNTIAYDTTSKFIAENYNIVKTEGALSITGQSIVPDPDHPDTYKGVTINDPSDSVYDGKDHKWTPEVKDVNGKALTEGTDYTVSYDTTDFVDANTITVTITGKGNYSGTATKTYKITPAPLKVTTPSASKVYDGTPLTAKKGTAENIEGLVNGETATVKASGSQTEVGTSNNTYEGIEWGTAKESNYTITSANEGILNVTPKSIADEEHGMNVGMLESVTYNGLEQAQKPEVKDGSTTLVEGKDYDLSYSNNVTDAGTVTVTVTGKGNYAGSVDRTYQILPAPLVVTTPTTSKVYDGTALTAEGSIDGFVNNETADFTTTGSQTAVGSSTNTYAINWTGSAKQSNYTISETLGTLTVSEYGDEVVAAAVGGTYTYDGKAHGATVQVSGLPAGYTVKEASSDAAATDVTEEDVTANVDHLVIVNAAGEDVTSKLKITKTPGTIKVNPATLTVTTPSASMPYNGSALTAEGKVSGFVNNEDATFTTTGSQTLVGTSENTYRIDWNGTAKQSNYTVDEHLGTLEVTKNQAAVVIVPQGGTKVYDGTALTSTGATAYGLPAGYTVSATTAGAQVDAGNSLATIASYTITDGSGKDVTDQFGNVSTGSANLTVTKRPVTLTSQGGTWTYDGNAHKNEAVEVSSGENEGFVDGQGFDYSNFASITAVGTVANTFEYKAKNGTKAENYEVKVATQNLVVEAKSIDPSVEASMSVDSPSDVIYDAKEHKWAPVVKDGDKALVEGTDYTVTYPDGQDFTNVKGAITATITGMGNYKGAVNRTYQITPASVKLESNTHEFTYNGTYQSDDEVKVSGADALFKSQVDGLMATGKVKDVAEGKVPNTIAYTWKDGFTSSNYKVETTTGELSVKAKDITPSEEAGMAVNDPSDIVYDGNEHKWVPEVKDGNKVLVEGSDYTVAYNKTDFTNVTGDIKVTITGIGNYAGTVEKHYQITKRDVVVASGSDSKVYDGNALTSPDAFAVGYYDFVKGDVTSVGATGTITMPGSVTNDINIAWANDTVATNYNVTLQPGTLTVSAKSITGRDMTVGTLPDVTYNGTEQIQKPEVKDGNNTLTEVTDYDLSFSDDVTNVGTVTVTVTGKGGYTGSTQVTYRINPAVLTVNTPSMSKAYDGTALTAEGSISGFVNNETATFTTTGSQTTVGSSANTYSIDWNGTAKQSNYQINETVGQLTVTESENEVVVTTTGGTFTYDGQPHGATVAVTNLPAGYTAQATSNASATDVNGEGIAATADNLVIYNTNGEDVTDKLNVKRIDGAIKVLPKELSVTTPDASKVYDGEALTAEGSITGFVPGEEATFATTGSQTDEGDSQNTYSLVWDGNAKESNYTVTEKLGTLHVSRQTINPEDPENPQTYDGAQVNYPQDVTYDGQEHKWAPTVTNKKGVELVEGTDYTVSYDKSNFTDVTGDILVTITGIGNYSGSVTRTYKINPATYYVVTDGASKTYDGSELTAPGRVVGLVNGEEVAFETTGSQTEVGSSANNYSLKFSKSAKESNYTHGTDTIGLLKVDAAKAEGNITLEGAPASKTYDGSPLEAGVAQASASAEGNDVTIEYSTDGVRWTTDPSTITATDVADSTTVQLRASSPKNYEGYVYGSEALTITKRSVNLASESGSKAFDGTPLTKTEVSGWQQQGDEGFVTGEVDNVRATGSVAYVSDGEVTNTIAYDTKEGFKEGNYTVAKAEGTLHITGQSINPGDGDSYQGIQISDPSNVEYDGQQHIWSPVVTDKNGNVLTEGVDYTVAYPEGQDFTNVTGNITATITGIGNYTGTVKKSYQVTPKELTVNTESATKVYDGTPLTAPGHIEGLVGSETATVNTPSSQTAVGSTFNFATSIVWGTAQERNYTWKIGEVGTLTVTAQSIVPDPENPDSYKGITISDPEDAVYDGAEHKWAPVVKDANGNVLTEGVDYDVTYKQGQDFTNVTGAIEATITGKGNYTGTATKSYQVTPKALTVNTDSASKVYDGTALTAGGSIEGLVGSETATVKTSKSQTEVGSTANDEYTIAWGSAKQSNYTVNNGTFGTLAVTGQSINPGDDGSYKGITISDPANVTYDGTEHKWAPVVKDANGKILTEGTDYTVVYPDGQDFTNVTGNITATITGIGNYTGTVKKSYQVTPAQLTVNTDGATATYNGTALTAGGSVEGLVGNETATVKTSKSQTDVGSTANDAYTIEWGTAQSRNYTVNDGTFGTLAVTPAPIQIKTESANKVYDGTALTAGGQLTGLVNGETATFTVTGSQTAVGSSTNTYTLEWNGTAKQSNYTIESVETGTLTVTESEDQIVVTTTGGTFTYDGQAHGATVSVGALPAGYSVKVAQSSASATNVAEGEVAATADNLVIVNAQGEEVTSKLNIVKVDGSIQIVPAEFTVTTGSAQKQYDGTALTNSELQIAGLVGDEKVTARTTGSQTEVGSSANTYEIDWGNTDSANYTIAAENLGTLTVTEVPAPVVPPVTPGTSTTPTNGTTPGGTNPASGNPVLNNVARALEGNFNAITGNNESAANVAAGEQIYDEENPLGTTYEDVCWVHFYIILGMILSGIYGLGVMFRRLNHTRKLRNDMNDVMGDGDGKDAEKAPTPSSNPAGMEA